MRAGFFMIYCPGDHESSLVSRGYGIPTIKIKCWTKDAKNLTKCVHKLTNLSLKLRESMRHTFTLSFIIYLPR